MIPEGLGTFALLCFTSMLAITNPLSAAPVFLALTAGYTRPHQQRTLRVAVLTAAVVLVLFALLGGAIFRVFGITIDAFRIAGGIIIFDIGMDMLQARRSRMKATAEEEAEGMVKEEVAITPLGIPMIVGPGAITTVMVLMADAATPWHMAALFGTIFVVLTAMYLTLGAAPRVLRRFGQTGLNVMTRIMGLIITVIAVQFIVDGVRPLLIDVLRRAAGAE